MSMNVLVMPGDGIGPEVTREGVRVLTAAAEICGFDVALRHFDVGEGAFQESGSHISEEALNACDEGQTKGNTAVLFGAVPSEPIGLLRERYDLYANLRPVRSYPGLSGISPLKPETIDGTDMLVVRELTSDVYYGKQRQGSGSGGAWASQEMYYDEHQARRIARVAFDAARRRRKKLTFAHKSNAIGPVFSVWWNVLASLREQYPEVVFDDFYVDNMAAQLCLRPTDFDVILAPNLFGDILSDLAGGLVGSLGLLPSASLNDRGFGLYEPVSGTAPTIAGKNTANPIGSILSVAMMCEHACDRVDARELIETAVLSTIRTSATPDIGPSASSVTTTELGKAVVDQMYEAAARA